MAYKHLSCCNCLIFYSIFNTAIVISPIIIQAKIQKHQAFEAEVAAHSNAIVTLDNAGKEMIDQNHFASQTIQVTFYYLDITIN